MSITLLLGGPNNVTYSHGQHSSRRDVIKQFSANQIPPEVEKGLIKLGIDPQAMQVQEAKDAQTQDDATTQTRPNTACETTTRGRAGIYPGKSFFHNCVHSLLIYTKQRNAPNPRVRALDLVVKDAPKPRFKTQNLDMCSCIYFRCF